MSASCVQGFLDGLWLVAQEKEFAAIKDRGFDNIITLKVDLLPAGSLCQDVGYEAINDNIGAPKCWPKAMFNML